MAQKLYVGNLSYGVNDEALKEMFSAAGTVSSATIITDRMSGRSKGFGFVEMSSDSEAQAAIDMFNGKEIEGRALTVNEARPKEDRPRNAGGFGGGNGRGRDFGGRRDRY
ncbi:MAG: RNA-binding protein [Candidatus Moranbacteria bacterium RIFOXYA12_FULL_35_19]|nr:MAG: RNP-1 like protein RNA-binding protein, Glycine-rich [Candidatus Moranbacteria bacterium GW2011_GWF2_35_39]OGI31929.1 MAG: RNA-binding protein [Candidatus Moranbacteria bacterium RIFOXYB12_FULL_35_8]OGI35383.1 MAG: RNA-binding protein [Candidatus Moranbacteria bacterium RIFOXYA12_FULL_35_19]